MVESVTGAISARCITDSARVLYARESACARDYAYAVQCRGRSACGVVLTQRIRIDKIRKESFKFLELLRAFDLEKVLCVEQVASNELK